MIRKLTLIVVASIFIFIGIAGAEEEQTILKGKETNFAVLSKGDNWAALEEVDIESGGQITYFIKGNGNSDIDSINIQELEKRGDKLNMKEFIGLVDDDGHFEIWGVYRGDGSSEEMVRKNELKLLVHREMDVFLQAIKLRW